MSSAMRYLTDPRRARNVQDGLFAVMVMGVAVAMMLFLLGSADIMTSLSIIGILLCMSLVGSVMRFFSQTRLDTDLRDAQATLDRSLQTLQHRIGDHDLTLLQMAGQIENLETSIETIKKTQTLNAHQHAAFMHTMKDKMMQLIQALAKSRVEKKTDVKNARKKSAPKNFFTPPSMTANDVAPGPAPTKASERYDDDVFVSPALMRDAIETAIKHARIDTYVQPLATLPQRRLFGYTVQGRIRFQPGVYIPARQYRGHAAHAGQQVALDRLVLAGLQPLIKSLNAQRIFVNLCAEGLIDPDTVRMITTLASHYAIKNNLVIELSQRDVTRISEREEKVIAALQNMGVKFGMNDVKNQDLDLNKLARLKFTYLKMPYNQLVTTKDSDQGAAALQRFVTRLQTRDIQLIVGQVEDVGDVRTMLDYPIALAQGYAFGRPDRPVAYQPKTKAA